MHQPRTIRVFTCVSGNCAVEQLSRYRWLVIRPWGATDGWLNLYRVSVPLIDDARASDELSAVHLSTL